MPRHGQLTRAPSAPLAAGWWERMTMPDASVRIRPRFVKERADRCDLARRKPVARDRLHGMSIRRVLDPRGLGSHSHSSSRFIAPTSQEFFPGPGALKTAATITTSVKDAGPVVSVARPSPADVTTSCSVGSCVQSGGCQVSRTRSSSRSCESRPALLPWSRSPLSLRQNGDALAQPDRDARRRRGEGPHRLERTVDRLRHPDLPASVAGPDL